MLSGDAAAGRHTLGPAADDARQPVAAFSPCNRSPKQRRRSKSLTRALPVGRPSGGSGQPPPPEPPALPGVELRRPDPPPSRGLAPPQPPFRFWVDELLWSQGRVAVELLEQVLSEAGGLRTGGPSREQERERRRRMLAAAAAAAAGPRPHPGPCLGSQHLGSWEVLWTKSTYAIPAARAMQPGQLVSAIIGLNSLTMKKRLLLTLRGVLGPDAAFAITPCSFALPEELDAWQEWIRRRQQQNQLQQQQQDRKQDRKQERKQGLADGQEDKVSCHGGASSGGGGGGGALPWSSLWILKTGQDAGKGLSLLPADQAVRYARQQFQQQQQRKADGGDGGGGGGGGGGSGGGRRFELQVAQLYIAEPFLIHGRKFHLRLWLLVTCHCPLRAYLHRRGLVLFSSELYDKAAVHTAAAAAVAASPDAKPMQASTDGAATAVVTEGGAMAPFAPPASHVTNYARNNNTLVWSLGQLEEHLGSQRFRGLWVALCGACGAAMAAAAPSLVEAHAWLAPAVQEYGFQVLGVDFLLDERLTPWLLECNSAPSIMVQHECEDTRALVYEQKYGMLRDTWEIVRGRVYGPGGERERAAAAAGQGATARWEAAHTGEYEPLMPYMTL